MNLSQRIKNYFRVKNCKVKKFVVITRNDTCFCGSGIKYKKCHEQKLKSNNKIVCWVYSIEGLKVGYKILKGNRGNRIKSSLRWEEIGVGGNGLIDP